MPSVIAIAVIPLVRSIGQNYAVYKCVCAVDFNFSVLGDVEITGISVELRLDCDLRGIPTAWLVKATPTIIISVGPRKGRISNLFVLTQVLCTTVFWSDPIPA